MSESQIQRAVMNWWALAHRGLGIPDERLLMAFPLQGARTPRNGARMKAEGLRKGTPDMFLAVARKGKHGLWIELKAEKGRLSDSQFEMLNILTAQDFKAVQTTGFDETLNILTNYLSE